MEGSFRIPLFGKFILDEAQFFELCNKLRTSMDPAIKQAELTNREVERIIKEAEFRGKQMMDRAQEDAKGLTQENVVLKAARDEAEKVLAESRKQAQDMQLQSYQYAYRIMSELSRYLNTNLTAVKNGEEELKKMLPDMQDRK